jgi:hypothetical protein
LPIPKINQGFLKENKMKKCLFLMGNLGIMLALGFVLVGCDNESPDANESKWWEWVDDTSTATLNYSIDSYGENIITIGGTANSELDGWKVQVGFPYTGEKGATYIFTFDWWAEGSAFENVLISYAKHGDEKEDLYWRFEDDSILKTIPTKRETIALEATIPNDVTGMNMMFGFGSDTGTIHITNVSIKKK